MVSINNYDYASERVLSASRVFFIPVIIGFIMLWPALRNKSKSSEINIARLIVGGGILVFNLLPFLEFVSKGFSFFSYYDVSIIELYFNNSDFSARIFLFFVEFISAFVLIRPLIIGKAVELNADAKNKLKDNLNQQIEREKVTVNTNYSALKTQLTSIISSKGKTISESANGIVDSVVENDFRASKKEFDDTNSQGETAENKSYEKNESHYTYVHCNNCGKEIKKAQKYCGYCGQKTENKIDLQKHALPTLGNSEGLNDLVESSNRQELYSTPDIILPSGAIIIEKNAFLGKNINSVLFPSSLINIKEASFQNNRLKIIELPQSLKHIGKGAFIGNSIVTIRIGSEVDIEDNILSAEDNNFRDAYKMGNAGTYNNQSGEWIKSKSEI